MDVGLAKGERTRARLLEIAVRRFAAEGYRRTSVSSVAREAGLTPAAAYAYFDGKEGLFEAALDLDAHALIDEATAGLADGAGLRNAYPAFLGLLVEGLDRHPLARRVLAGLEPDMIDRVLDLSALLDVRSLIAGELERAQAAGDLRPDIDARTLAVGLETVVLSLLMASLQVAEVGDERSAGVTAVFDALLTPPPPPA